MAHKIRLEKYQKEKPKLINRDFLTGGILLMMIGAMLVGLGASGQYYVSGLVNVGIIIAIIGLIFLSYFIKSHVKDPPEK